MTLTCNESDKHMFSSLDLIEDYEIATTRDCKCVNNFVDEEFKDGFKEKSEDHFLEFN